MFLRFVQLHPVMLGLRKLPSFRSSGDVRLYCLVQVRAGHAGCCPSRDAKSCR